MKLILFAFLTCIATASAADGQLLTLIVPPVEGDRFQHEEFSFWIPDGSKPIKAVIIHQHGCTNASPDKHPPITSDWHWRALARKHNAALLVPMYHVAKNCDEWNDPDSGSERALLAALVDFSKQSGRAEGAVGTLRWLELVRADDRATSGACAGGLVSRRMSQAVW